MVGPNDIKLKVLEEAGTHGRFAIEPLNRGYGYTLGNSLRRILLSALPGAAATEVRFSGVPHQFTTIPGVKEDLIQLTLNLKKIRFSLAEGKAVGLQILAKGKKVVTAGDIEAVAGVSVANPDLVLATLTDKTAKLEAELLVEPGFGYVPSDDRKPERVGAIPLDCIFTPVANVTYRVEGTRLGQMANLDRLILEIETDGTIRPTEALVKGSEILMRYFYRLAQGEISEEILAAVDGELAKVLAPEEGNLPIEDLELPTRVTNSLKKGNVKTCGDLVKLIQEGGLAALTKVQNVGEKSINEIKTKVVERGWINEEV